MIFGLVVLAVIVGSLMPVQAALNGELSKFASNTYLAAFVSFATGAVTLGLILIARGTPLSDYKKLTTVSPHLFLGGVLGSLFVVSSVYFVPRIGATMMIAAFVTGQLLMSVTLDHFGLFGLREIPLTWQRSLGVLMLFAGLFLVIRKPA